MTELIKKKEKKTRRIFTFASIHIEMCSIKRISKQNKKKQDRDTAYYLNISVD